MSEKLPRFFFNSFRYSLEPLALHSAWTYFPAPPKEEIHFLIYGHAEVFSVYYLPPDFIILLFRLTIKEVDDFINT